MNVAELGNFLYMFDVRGCICLPLLPKWKRWYIWIKFWCLPTSVLCPIFTISISCVSLYICGRCMSTNKPKSYSNVPHYILNKSWPNTQLTGLWKIIMYCQIHLCTFIYKSNRTSNPIKPLIIFRSIPKKKNHSLIILLLLVRFFDSFSLYNPPHSWFIHFFSLKFKSTQHLTPSIERLGWFHFHFAYRFGSAWVFLIRLNRGLGG